MNTKTSATMVAVFIQLAVVILPMFGVQIISADLTNAVQTFTTIFTGLFFWYKRFSQGDITIFGSYVS